MKLKIIEKFSSPFRTIRYIRYLIPENDFEKQVIRIISMLRATADRLENQWASRAIYENKVIHGPSIFDYYTDDDQNA